MSDGNSLTPGLEEQFAAKAAWLAGNRGQAAVLKVLEHLMAGQSKIQKAIESEEAGQTEQALKLYREILATNRHEYLFDGLGVSQSLIRATQMLPAVGRADEADEWIREALTTFKFHHPAIRDDDFLAEVFLLLMNALVEKNRTASQPWVIFLQRAAEQTEGCKDIIFAGLCYLALVQEAVGRGDFTEANRLLALGDDRLRMKANSMIWGLRCIVSAEVKFNGFDYWDAGVDAERARQIFLRFGRAAYAATARQTCDKAHELQQEAETLGVGTHGSVTPRELSSADRCLRGLFRYILLSHREEMSREKHMESLQEFVSDPDFLSTFFAVFGDETKMERVCRFLAYLSRKHSEVSRTSQEIRAFNAAYAAWLESENARRLPQVVVLIRRMAGARRDEVGPLIKTWEENGTWESFRKGVLAGDWLKGSNRSSVSTPNPAPRTLPQIAHELRKGAITYDDMRTAVRQCYAAASFTADDVVSLLDRARYVAGNGLTGDAHVLAVVGREAAAAAGWKDIMCQALERMVGACPQAAERLAAHEELSETYAALAHHDMQLAAVTAHAVALGRLQHWLAAEEKFELAADLAASLSPAWPSACGLVKLFEAEYRLLRGDIPSARQALAAARKHSGFGSRTTQAARLHLLEFLAGDHDGARLIAASKSLPAEKDARSQEVCSAVEVLSVACLGGDHPAAQQALARVHDPLGKAWILILQLQALLRLRPSSSIRDAAAQLETIATSLADSRFRAWVLLLSAGSLAAVHRPEEAVYACTAALSLAESASQSSDLCALAFCQRANALYTLGSEPEAKQDITAAESLVMGPNSQVMDAHARLDVTARLAEWYAAAEDKTKALDYKAKALHYADIVQHDASHEGTEAWLRATAAKAGIGDETVAVCDLPDKFHVPALRAADAPNRLLLVQKELDFHLARLRSSAPAAGDDQLVAEAIKQLRESGDNGRLCGWLEFDGDRHHQAKRWAEAAACYMEASEHHEEMRNGIVFPDFKAAFGRRAEGLYAKLVEALSMSGRKVTAFEMAERCRCRAQLDLVANQEVTGSQHQITQQGADRLALCRELAGDPEKIRRFWYRRPILPSPAEEIQSLLEDDELLLELFVTETDLLKFCVSKKQIDLTTVTGAGKATIREAVESIMRFGKESLTSPAGADAKLGELVYRGLPQELLRSGRLYCIPHGPLRALPWNSLGPEGFVAPGHRVAVLPSASVFAMLKKRPLRDLKQVCVFANPTRTKSVDLPGATSEAEAIEKFFPSAKMYKGENASAAALLDHATMAEVDVLHLGVHLSEDKASPGNWSLELSGTSSASAERVTFRQIRDHHTSAQLVFCATCDSDTGVPKLGDEQESLVTAFFCAGATQLIGTKWRLHDKSASLIVREFYWQLHKGVHANEAVAIAQEMCSKQPGFSPPFFWAGLQFSGLLPPCSSRR